MEQTGYKPISNVSWFLKVPQQYIVKIISKHQRLDKRPTTINQAAPLLKCVPSPPCHFFEIIWIQDKCNDMHVVDDDDDDLKDDEKITIFYKHTYWYISG